MTGQSQPLTAANIRYLLALQELDLEGRGVRCVDLAGRLSLTKPSVHAMIGTLERLELVSRERYGTIHLTEPGRARAEQYRDCYALLLQELCDALKLPEEEGQNAACAVLSQMQEQSLALLRAHAPAAQEKGEPDVCS